MQQDVPFYKHVKKKYNSKENNENGHSLIWMKMSGYTFDITGTCEKVLCFILYNIRKIWTHDQVIFFVTGICVFAVPVVLFTC